MSENLKRKTLSRSAARGPAPLTKRAAGIRQRARALRKQPAHKLFRKLGSKIAEGSTVTIHCRLESFRGEQARCWAEISGAKVPIDLPSAVLREAKVRENAWFTWTFSEMLPISSGRAQPIKEPSPGQATRPDQEEIKRLWQQAIESREQGLWAFLNDQ
jgi:hypothetical protein